MKDSLRVYKSSKKLKILSIYSINRKLKVTKNKKEKIFEKLKNS